MSLDDSFYAFANQGKSGGGKKSIDNKNWAKLCKDCKVQDNKSVTSADVDITFSKYKTKGKNDMTLEQFKLALKELSGKRFKGKDDAMEQICALIAGRGPGLSGVTKESKTGGVGRMTDTSQYTGSHKERFDESGHGKGLDGRKELVANTGYVGNYKGDGTYEDKAGKK